ncbi:phosphoesterase [Cellulomonas sp. WB94]|nr:2'-5' RNA ligase family protein [Cellulomonas sp. WB94]PVU83598.1 phosphoesterase [Cellulomonas sp. WB94]
MNLPETSGEQLRIGVAVTVPQPYSATLQAARGRVGDPAAPSIPPHITLLGPTAVEPGDLAAVERHLEEVASHHRPFVLRLRGTGTFRPVSPVVFVQVVEGIAGCEALERHIRTGPLEQGLRFNYHPHVTVAHEVSEAALDLAFVELSRFDATFVVHAFHSYEYGDDEVWRPVRDFPLTGAADVAAARLHGSRVVPGAGVPGSS